MASSGKKRNKTVWKPAPQDGIFDISGRSITNWAEEVENVEAEEYYDPKPVVLPTAPRSSCMVAVDETKVPLSPPFQAHVSNLPYELTEEELKDLFTESNVKEVKIPKEDRGNRAKGYGYVVFEDRVSLITALHMAEVYVKGRSIRIELATSDSGRGGSRSRGNQRSDGGSMNSSSVDRTSGNWRSGPREEADDRDRGGPRREYNTGGGGGGGGGGGFSRRDDSFHERRDRDDRFRGEKERSFERPRYEDSNRSTFRRDDRPREDPPPSASSEPKNRPKLNLKPRSSDLPPPAATNEPTTSNSIFGNAKPVDTSAKLREIEERLAKNEILSDKSRSAGSSTGSSSSAARSGADLKERKAEPAQLPKENPWTKSRPSQQTPRASRPEEQKDI